MGNELRKPLDGETLWVLYVADTYFVQPKRENEQFLHFPIKSEITIADTVEEAEKLAQAKQYDYICVGTQLPAKTQLEAILKFRAAYPRARVIAYFGEHGLTNEDLKSFQEHKIVPRDMVGLVRDVRKLYLGELFGELSL
jgi:hypothetical protein